MVYFALVQWVLGYLHVDIDSNKPISRNVPLIIDMLCRFTVKNVSFSAYQYTLVLNDCFCMFVPEKMAGYSTRRTNRKLRENNVIKCEDNVNLFGLRLNFNVHISSICKRASTQLKVLTRIGDLGS